MTGAATTAGKRRRWSTPAKWLMASPNAMSDILRLDFCGAELVADPSGALAWPERRLLVVADLHLEKGSSFARSGSLLPPYDTRATLEALETVIARHQPQTVLCLGDSFHDGEGPARLGQADRARLAALVARHDWIWLAGNHDPAPPPSIGGRVEPDMIALGPLTFRHLAARKTEPGEISGHYHPKLSLFVRARRLTGRCFLADDRRIVLPAFGAYTGGLDARDPALLALFPDGCTVHFIGRDRMASLPRDGIALLS